jgi:hypothetical protein
MPFDERPEPGEPLSRFIFTRDHFTHTRVKPGAFLPSPATLETPLETSIFRGAGLHRDGIEAARRDAGALSGRTLKAWATVVARVVFEAGLDIYPDNDPPRHAAIRGWPQEKDVQLSLAQKLAVAATLNQAQLAP